MASNKFTARRYRGSYPPYCIPKPVGGPVIPPGAPGLRLQCFARWTDLDPLAPGDMSRYFPLDRIGPGNIYFGQSTFIGDRLTLEVHQIGTTYFWDVTIEIWDPWRTPETYTWTSVYVEPAKSFDTRMLEQIHVVDLDYRRARITA